MVWIEECTELTAEDWITLSLTIRGKGDEEVKQRILSFNRSQGNWTEEEFFHPDGSFKDSPEIFHHHSTFLDNRFLDEGFCAILRRLEVEDPESYKKNALGLPIKLKGVIYDRWRIDPFQEDCPEVIYGLDFGYSPDPTVLVRIGIKGYDLFVDELLYDRKLTNSDVISKLRELSVHKARDIYGDSAEPDRIEEIHRAGWNCKPADKGPRSVEFGIDLLKRYTLHISPRSINLKKDLENYKWKTDKNGAVISPPVPNHAFSHGPDAIRYPVYTHLRSPNMLSVEDLESIELSRFASAGIRGF